MFFGGSTGTARASFDGPIAPTDLLNLPLGLGEGGCGRPSENVALLLAGRTDNFRGLIGGGGGWGRDTLGLLFFLLSSMRAVTLLRRQRQEIKIEKTSALSYSALKWFQDLSPVGITLLFNHYCCGSQC